MISRPLEELLPALPVPLNGSGSYPGSSKQRNRLMMSRSLHDQAGNAVGNQSPHGSTPTSERPSRPEAGKLSAYITQTHTNTILETMYCKRLVRRLIQLLRYRELLHSGARRRSFRAHVKLLPVLDTLADTVGILQCNPIQFTKTDQSDCMK